jgi:hypothetical protein
MQAADVLAAFAGTSYRPRLDDTRTGPMGGDSGGTAVGKPSQ